MIEVKDPKDFGLSEEDVRRSVEEHRRKMERIRRRQELRKRAKENNSNGKSSGGSEPTVRQKAHDAEFAEWFKENYGIDLSITQVRRNPGAWREFQEFKQAKAKGDNKEEGDKPLELKEVVEEKSEDKHDPIGGEDLKLHNVEGGDLDKAA